MRHIDFHSHILPGADHGSNSSETSLAQLALLRKAEVGAVVATPHFYPTQSSVKSFLELRASAERRLSEILTEADPAVYIGAEVLVCPGMEEMDGFEKLCIVGSDVMLLELPYQRLNNQLFYSIENIIHTTSIRPVLAHVDRYHPDDIADLMNLPLYAQINAESLKERKNRKWLSSYLEADRVVGFGSDLHGAEKDALKGYLKGLSKIGSKKEERVNAFAASFLKNAERLNKI
jgi:protein-tyrosine phosphatase